MSRVASLQQLSRLVLSSLDRICHYGSSLPLLRSHFLTRGMGAASGGISPFSRPTEMWDMVFPGFTGRVPVEPQEWFPG